MSSNDYYSPALPVVQVCLLDLSPSLSPMPWSTCLVRHTYATPSQRSYVDSRKASPKLRGGVYRAVLEGKQPGARRLSVL